MVTLSYTVVEKERVSIRFACLDDANEVAWQLVELPGIINITLQEDGFKPYPIHKAYRYVVFYSNDMRGEKWLKKNFSYISDAARFGEDQMYYQIHDMFENVILKPEDVECLV